MKFFYALYLHHPLTTTPTNQGTKEYTHVLSENNKRPFFPFLFFHKNDNIPKKKPFSLNTYLKEAPNAKIP